MFNLLYANFYVKPGDGGNGSNAFNISLFNKKIYHGGSGGNGGNIIFKYSNNILINNNFNSNKISAENGQNGKHGKKNGKNGADTIIHTSQICQINLINENMNYKIHEKNQFFIIKGGVGGVGSRYAKNIYSDFKGEKSKIYKISMKVILPNGSCFIFSKYNINTINSIQQLFGYKCNIKQDILCLNYNNNNIYIFFIDVYKSIEILKENIYSINTIKFYSDNLYDPYNLTSFIIQNNKPYSFLTNSIHDINCPNR